MPQLLVISDANVLIDMEAGDLRMRKLARSEGRAVHGTLWLVAELVRTGRIKAARARRAYDAMRAADRWLPWDDVERQIRSFKG